MDHNRYHAIGRLVKDPEFIPKGRKGDAHCVFTLAINRVVANEKGPKADFVPCSLWGKEAERFVEIRAKGDTVGIKGRIRTEFVPLPSGKTNFFWEVRVDEVHYGQRSLKNLQPKPQETPATKAVGQLSAEFSDGVRGQ